MSAFHERPCLSILETEDMALKKRAQPLLPLVERAKLSATSSNSEGRVGKEDSKGIGGAEIKDGAPGVLGFFRLANLPPVINE
jgi:hypothetical protein